MGTGERHPERVAARGGTVTAGPSTSGRDRVQPHLRPPGVPRRPGPLRRSGAVARITALLRASRRGSRPARRQVDRTDVGILISRLTEPRAGDRMWSNRSPASVGWSPGPELGLVLNAHGSLGLANVALPKALSSGNRRFRAREMFMTARPTMAIDCPTRSESWRGLADLDEDRVAAAINRPATNMRSIIDRTMIGWSKGRAARPLMPGVAMSRPIKAPRGRRPPCGSTGPRTG